MSEAVQARANVPAMAAPSLIAVIFINMLGFGIIVPLLPFYAKSFDAEAWQIALVFSAYSAGSFFGEPFWGRLSDRFGRKPLLVSTIAANCLCYFALAFAPNVWAAIVIRLLGGLAAGNGAVVQGYLADVTPPEKRAGKMAWIGAAWNVGLIFGPMVGGIFAHPESGPAGFRTPLFLASGLAALSVISIALFIRESREREPLGERPSRWGALGAAAGSPVISRLMLLTFLVGFAFTGIESVFGLWAQARFEWGPREIGVCFFFVGIAAALTQTLVTGRLSERYGAGRMLAIGMAVTCVCSALQPLSPTGAVTIALMSLTAIGQSVAWPNVSALISRTADPDKQGAILGLNNAMGALARVVGPFCAGLAFANVSIHGPFWLGAIVVAPAILLAVEAARRAKAMEME
ncbi:MAG: MFS transporter [Phenylobacterium sp.]|jgi:MFS family permease|uniref:MFS transporter n=1 Tax=Phenylobacterium sp. TaxID=1871053 RepID=UPI002A3721A5|nr:MFS transporter [Phenylobacterium sp.]MDX9998534.1 MFS transporter [Phenylobacterium sp.]